MEMPCVRWGVIGAGGVADRQMLPNTQDVSVARWVAVMRRTAEGARAIAEKYGIPRWYDTVEGLLEDEEVEAVYIATPVAYHCEQAVAAAEHGKHVLLEKPMARTPEEGRRILEACRSYGVRLMVCFPLRFSLTYQHLRALIQRGHLGRIVEMRAQLAKWYPLSPEAWRSRPELSGGGVLMDLGSHLLDLARWLVGEVREVAAFVGQLAFPLPVEDTAVALLRFANGAVGVVDVAFSVARSENLLEVYGTEGMAFIGPGEPRGRVMRQGQVEPLPESPLSPYRAELEHFSRAILEGIPLLSTGEDGLRNVELIEAAYRSAREGRWVAV